MTKLKNMIENDNVIINNVSIAPEISRIEVIHENIAIVRGANNYLYIEDETNYFQLIGEITYTKEDLKMIIEKYKDGKWKINN